MTRPLQKRRVNTIRMYEGTYRCSEPTNHALKQIAEKRNYSVSRLVAIAIHALIHKWIDIDAVEKEMGLK